MSYTDHINLQGHYENGQITYPWIPLNRASRLLPLLIYKASREARHERPSTGEHLSADRPPAIEIEACCGCAAIQRISQVAVLTTRDFAAELAAQRDRVFGPSSRED